MTTTLDVFRYEVDDDVFDCFHCGEPLEDGQEVVQEPDNYGGRKVLVTVHAHCAIRDGYRLSWPN